MEELRQKIAEVINEAPLPFEAKVYVLRDVMHEVESVYRAELIARNKPKEEPDGI